jgi:signal transduction histidine kinase
MAVAPKLRTRVASKPTFAQLVSLACHDLRTPLATASGFAHTLQRLDTIAAPADRYVEMIGAASQQMTDLLDLLGAAARIEAGRFEVQAREADSRALTDEAVAQLDDGEARADGTGAPVQVDPNWAHNALAALGGCVRRHGALEQVAFAVDGPEVSIGPVGEGVGEIALGDDLKDFGAAVGTRVLREMGAELAVDGERLVVRLPQAP